MKSYYVKGYYTGDSRNCQIHDNSASSICRFVIFRSDSCDNPFISESVELYNNADYNARGRLINSISLSQVQVTSTNCPLAADQYNTHLVGQAPYIFGAVLASSLLIAVYCLLVYGIIRRHL